MTATSEAGGATFDGPSLQERFAPDCRCFGCGPANPRGLRIRSFPAAEGLVCAWRPEEHHEAFAGVLNGGIIGTLLDCQGNWTACWFLKERDGLERPPVTVTADYTIRLRRPTPVDRTLRMTSRVVESSGPKVTVEGELLAGDKVTAEFRGHFMAVGDDHPAARHGLDGYSGPSRAS